MACRPCPSCSRPSRTAQSFVDVIENGLGVPFAEFDQKWQAWIKTNLAAAVTIRYNFPSQNLTERIEGQREERFSSSLLPSISVPSFSSMSPDIEWHVGEDAEQETIAQVTSRPALTLAQADRAAGRRVGSGAGRALRLDSRTPAADRAAHSTGPDATPFRTPLPPAPDLAETIDREARALASGDMPAFIGLLDPDEYALAARSNLVVHRRGVRRPAMPSSIASWTPDASTRSMPGPM